MTEKVIGIQANHFTAGIVALDGKVIATAPILRYMMGWDGKKVKGYCERKGWAIVK